MDMLFGNMDDGFDLFGMVFLGIWQAGFAFGGGIFALIGLAIIYDFFSWRTSPSKYVTHGDIIGVRVSNMTNEDGTLSEEEEALVNERLKKAAEEYSKNKKTAGPLTNIFGGFLGILFTVIFLGLPIGFFGFGAYTAVDFHNLQKNGVRAEATIVDYNSHYDSDSGTTYNAVVAYYDQHGNPYREQDKIGGGDQKFSIGQKMHVIYALDKPKHFYIDDYWHNMSLAYIFMGVGALFSFFIFGGFNAIADRVKGSKQYTSAPQKQRNTQSYAGEMYYEVIEYVTDRGEHIQAITDSGSSSLNSKVPGTRVSIIASKDNPQNIRRRTTLWLWLGLFICLAPGCGLIFLAFMDGISPVFFLVVAFFALTKGSKLLKMYSDYKSLSPEEKEGKKEKFSIRMEQKNEDNKNTRPFLDRYDVQDRIRYYKAQARLSSFILFVLASCGLVGAYYISPEFYQELYKTFSEAPQDILKLKWDKLNDDDFGSLALGGFGAVFMLLSIQTYLSSRSRRV